MVSGPDESRSSRASILLLVKFDKQSIEYVRLINFDLIKLHGVNLFPLSP